jgi:hypothetical protein
MADEICIKGLVGGKAAFTTVALPIGTEVVATILGTDDAMIVLRDGLTPAQGSVIVQNLVKELNEKFGEVHYVTP